MKKLYLILKILLVLGVLVAVAYLVTPPDDEVIIKRPWLTKEAVVDICENCKKDFGDLKIGAKRVREDDYLDANAKKQHGNVVELSILVRGDDSKSKTITVYEGQSFEIGAYSILVEKIDIGVKADPGLIGTAMGGVTLKITQLASNSDSKNDKALTIHSNTQGQYGDDLRIGVGNIGMGEYEINGVKESGVVATLWLYVRDKSEKNKTITVYIGQSFKIDKYVITVTDIHGELVSLRIGEDFK